MNLFQYLIVVFIIYTVVKMSLKLKRSVITLPVYFIWLVLWLSIGVLALMPQVLTYVAEFVGVGRGVDLAIYMAILAILYVIFKIYLRLEKLDRNISEIVQKVSIQNVHKKKLDE